jgi:hypothetical protein
MNRDAAQASRDAARGRGRPLSPAMAMAGGPRPLTVGAVPWFVHNFASQDWLVIGYLCALGGALVFGRGEHRAICLARVAADLGAYLCVLALVRLPLLRWGGLTSALLYRVTITATILASYFQLREILPAVSPWTDDARIYAFDMQVFGVEPSVWLDRFVSPATTEWFAFFYSLYFGIMSVHVLPVMLYEKDLRVVGRFALGVVLLFTIAHLLYMVVPGLGPYWYLKHVFQHELTGGTFWKLVREAVDAGGAQKDIFPSLHTALPTYLAIFSFRHRYRMPFKYTWIVIAFLATQIIVATMFLRWHYLVDVVAGLALALTASVLGQRIADWEFDRRPRLGVQPAWMPIEYPWMKGR